MEKSPIKFILHYVKLFKWLFYSLSAINILSKLGSYLSLFYAAKLYDIVAKTENVHYWQDIYFYLFLALSCQLTSILCFELTIYFASKLFPKSDTIVVRDVLDHVNRHSISYFTEKMSGNISNKISQISEGIRGFFDILFQFIDITVSPLIVIILLSMQNAVFSPVMLVWIMIMVFLGISFGKQRRASSEEYELIRSRTQGIIVDSISNYSEVKSFANYKFERRYLGLNLRRLRLSNLKDRMTHFKFHLTQNLITFFSVALFAFFTIWLLKTGRIDTSVFIFANISFANLSGLIFNIGYSTNNLFRILGTVQAGLNTLAVEPEIKDSPKAYDFKADKAEIVFDKVSFAYNGHKNLFNNLNLKIKPGEKVGIVGHSGAGKSTFIKLIARYFDIKQGTIKINGIDIRNITQDSLHKHIATIPQDVCLFNRSLMDNIRYGRTTAKDAEVFAAAKKANADEFIKKLPKGYSSKVGERGTILSGGERQRVAIARAVLKNAPILIFDEATSSLDSHSEQHIQKALKAVMKDKTVIAVAHRLSTLKEMDRIVVFDKGKIAEEGTHEALLAQKGLYAKLYKMQADGFISQ